WFPMYCYFCFQHEWCIALWGGEKFKQIQRFSHQGVQLIDFSPCERYLVTFSPLMDTKDDPQAIIIWDVLTGQKKRGFHCESSAHWPIFKDFSWSPGDNIIAFWVPEDKDIPARVTLMQLPSRQEIRVRNLFNVVDCKLHWQKNGDYLCVKVDRTPKGTQGMVTNFEIFRMREKQVPVDVVEMKEGIIAFAWEPNGSKFAVLHGEPPRINSSFYHVKNNGKIELIKTFDKQQANSIFWSPQGQFLVLAGLRSMNGALAFVDTSDCTMMNIAEHYMASDVEWDPTGRYVVTSVSWWSHKSMGLLDKKSLKITGIKDFSWSPGDNIIAFWVPEDKDIPARVTLMQLPSRQEIRVRNLFNVVDCKLHWQKNGDYLCVKVDRTPKGTQGMVTNFEIFRMREKQVPVDVVEMKEGIIAFAWEPNGSKFAVLHGEPPRINSSFYHVKNNGKIELIKTFDKQQANSIFWSPQGQFLVLAGLRSMNGALAFVDTSDCTMMNIAEHYMASDVEWDPTGRYVVTSVSWWSHKLIKKDLKKYSKIFEQKDRLSQSKASKGNLRHWLEDVDCRDQYSVIFESGERTGIFANDAKEPIVVEERARWTETYVRWSPRGTYLATFHQRGIALWGGEKFKQIQRFSHQGVQLIDFSPCERYLVTFSPLMDTKDDPQAIIIWDVLTGQKKRGFHCESSAHWPIFKWSHDGKFFARMTQDTLSIYETPSMGLLDKKSLKITGIKDFSWSPGDNIIAFWVPEDKDIPARVTLMQLPSRQEIRVRNLFNVVDCKLHWQKNGDYLCVKVDRTPKGTQGMVTNFEIFRMREKQVPVDVVEMKEGIIAFAWEPNGSKFAVLHGEPPRINSSFYHVKNNGKIELIKTFDKQQANSIFWSPQGQFLVLAGLRSMNGALAFVDTSDCTMMNIAEHYMASDVEWDPTGRYVVTSVSWWSHKECTCVCVCVCVYEETKHINDSLLPLLTLCQILIHCKPTSVSLSSSGVDTDELDSNVEDWEEETIEFFVNEEIIPLGEQV
ncbi:UNVERIFIED_CONTAM: hypothetical protein FKN15_003103, partial [Acipenser sinensis]